MGVSLSYTSIAPVSAKVKKTILADADRINEEHIWWREGIIFYEVKKNSKLLTGDTEIFMVNCYSDAEEESGLREVDFDDDQFMAYRDAAFILQQLMRWSKEHGVDWLLDMAGGELGTIKKGNIHPAGLFHCDKQESKTDERKAARLDKKYASRKA